MSRILTEEQQHWCDVIGEFAKKEIEPIMLDWDKVTDPSKAIPFDAYAKAFKLGLNAFEIPKEYGGSKVDLATAAVMYEEMGYYDGNFASVMQTTNLALKPVLIGGTPEQVQYFSKHILEGKGNPVRMHPTSRLPLSRMAMNGSSTARSASSPTAVKQTSPASLP